MEKVRTEIPGFDRLLKGGFPKGSVILLSGSPATGKTILSLQFLVNGAINDEKCLFITFEEKIGMIIEQASQFGWDLPKLQKKNTLFLQHIPSEEIDHRTVERIIDSVKRLNISRLVIDSINILALNIPDLASDYKNIGKYSVKRFIYRFINSLRGLKGVTTMLISQTVNEGALSSDEVSEFLCDGIIHLSYESMGGKYSRSLLVRKMRQVENDEDIHPLEISKKGLVVHTIR
ncbi:MAG: ATPase domain-containing protein [Candidatus Woesearchaeota archaeon]